MGPRTEPGGTPLVLCCSTYTVWRIICRDLLPGRKLCFQGCFKHYFLRFLVHLLTCVFIHFIFVWFKDVEPEPDLTLKLWKCPHCRSETQTVPHTDITALTHTHCAHDHAVKQMHIWTHTLTHMLTHAHANTHAHACWHTHRRRSVGGRVTLNTDSALPSHATPSTPLTHTHMHILL